MTGVSNIILPTGGPAGTAVTKWIEAKANELLEKDIGQIKRISFEKAIHASATHRYDYLNTYISDLGNIIEVIYAIRNSKIRMGVDPLGGAGVHYWQPIADRYHLDLTVTNKIVDPAFSFMTVDWGRANPHGPVFPLCHAALNPNER